MDEFLTGVGMLLNSSLERSPSKGMNDFWIDAIKNHKNLENFILLSQRRFQKFRASLDTGNDPNTAYTLSEAYRKAILISKFIT